MPSLREQIFQAAATLIGGLPEVAAFERNPDRDPQSTQLPLVVQIDEGRAEPTRATGCIEFENGVVFELTVIETASTTAEAALDELIVAITHAMLADPTLGDLADDIRLGEESDPEFTREEGHRRMAMIALEFFVRFTTQEKDITAIA